MALEDGYTVVWPHHDEMGCPELREYWLANLDNLIPTLVKEIGKHPCDVRVFKGRPCFSRWDRDLNDRWVALQTTLDKENEWREYQRLKEKFDR